jgi:hypothetical protein
MPARTTRQEARQRALNASTASLERIVPPDASVPLRGSTFRDREDRVAQMRAAVLPTVLGERAALEPDARVEDAGHCPHCGSDSTYLERPTTRPEVLSPDGPALVERQHGRHRGGRQAVQQAGQGDRAVLERGGRGDDPQPARHTDQSGRAMGTPLGHPRRVRQLTAA